MRTFVLTMALTAVVTPLLAQEQDPVYRLDGLVVTGAPQPRAESSMGAHVTVLDGPELRARGLTRMVDALRDVPGLTLVEGGSFGAVSSVFMRGGESDFVQVLIDGVQVNQPGGAFDFAGLTLENVERIEVLRGPASALYGSDAVGGVIHLITRGGRGALDGSLTARGGSFGRRDVTAELRGGGRTTSYGFSFSRTETDGILEFNNQFENQVLGGVVRVAPDERSRIELSARVASRDFHFPTDGTGNVVDRNAFSFVDDATLGLNVERRFTDRLSLELALSSYEADTGTDDAIDGPADTLGFYGYTSLASLRRSEARLESHLRLGEATTATAGIEAGSQDQRAFSESLSAFGLSSSQSANSRWNRAGFVHLVTGAGGVALNAGARLEDNEQFGRLGSWQAGASWAYAESGRLRASAGTGIKEPTFLENFSTGFVLGNPDLDPERSRSWEVGVEQSLLAGGLALSVTWFDQNFRDLIQYTSSPPAASDPNYFNVAEAAARGLEVGVTASIRELVLSADATVLDTEVLDSGFDSGEGATFVEGAPLLRRPGLILGGSVSHSLGSRGALTASARRVGTRDDRDFSTFPAAPVELEAYTLLGVGGEFAVTGPESGTRLVITLRAENLLDETYQEAFGFLAPGRAVYVGARVGLGGS